MSEHVANLEELKQALVEHRREAVKNFRAHPGGEVKISASVKDIQQCLAAINEAIDQEGAVG